MAAFFLRWTCERLLTSGTEKRSTRPRRGKAAKQNGEAVGEMGLSINAATRLPLNHPFQWDFPLETNYLPMLTSLILLLLVASLVHINC